MAYQKKQEEFGKGVSAGGLNKIGTYKEATGGGTPLAAGEKLADHPEAKRVMQPRDEDGKFTYNAANAKPLEYGPSRGVTVPPFLKGIKLTYAIKKEDKVVVGDHVFKACVDISAKEFLETFKEYDIEKGFGDIMKTKMDAKKGAKNKVEKSMIKSGEQGLENGKVMTSFSTGQTIEAVLDQFPEYKPKLEKIKASGMVPAKKVMLVKKDKPVETPKVETPKAEAPKTEAPKTEAPVSSVVSENSSGTKDGKSASADDYYLDHEQEILELADLADKKGLNVNLDSMVESLYKGETTPDEIKKLLSEAGA